MINLILKVLAGICLIAISPLIFISILFVLIEDGFPAIFVQERLGKNLKIFKIYKIRTMYQDTPNLGSHEVSASNYLKIGSILRKLKIDELPQVINFINGDINLIGPRPGLPSQIKLKEFRLKNGIFNTTPGITGLGQVLGYDMSNPEQLALIDALYIQNKSVKIDLMIFIATFLNLYKIKLSTIFIEEINRIKSKEYNV
ncbi:sugar transferase [Gammaproteobacteria bacterium]|nr:sugar transferase [Gammaproteobacteria bacterium]